MPSERFMRHYYGAGNYTPPRPSNQKPIKVQGIWLRRIGDYAEVLFEGLDGVWYMAIREHIEGNFSHIIEPAGMRECKPDPVTQEQP